MRHTWSEWSLIIAAVICRVRLSSGDRSFPRACTLVSSWVQEGSVEGSSAAPLRRLTGQDAGPLIPGSAAGQRKTKPPDSTPYLDPSFQNTAPPSQPLQHDEDTRSPVCFGHYIPFGHFILLFLFNKSLSEAWRHTHCVCRLLLPPQYIYIYIIYIIYIYIYIQCHEKVFAPFLFFFAYLSHLKDSDHQTNFYITQR